MIDSIDQDPHIVDGELIFEFCPQIISRPHKDLDEKVYHFKSGLVSKEEYACFVCINNNKVGVSTIISLFYCFYF